MNNIFPGDASDDVFAILKAQLEARTKVNIVIESIVLITIDIVALIGNAILCYIIYRNASLHNSTTMFIVSLAFTDLLTATLVMPLTIDAVVHSKRRFSDTVCKAHAFVMSVLAQVSIYLMAITAFNRYVCVVRRSLYKRIFTKKRTLFIIVVVWVVALFINGLPNVLSLDDFFFCPGCLVCWRRMMSPGAIYGFNAWFYGSFTVAYVVIVVCCWKVFRAVSQHNAEVATNLRQGCHNEEVSVSKAVATIVLSFTLCWIPGEVVRTMGRINPLLLPRQVYLMATSLWFLSSAINPFIYGVMNSAFRTE
ncbi:melatonin receptor type 1B-B-like isoform X2 [Montipora capricornis]|uniref:melatonin receptor type 1B-B-like isoform X2 n=1 Tax=Montipora capricornis TaxID=246305 RepID=UPI0035F10ECA